MSTHRLAYIDNLRWSAISMVVVIHAAGTYSGFGDWYFTDLQPLPLALRVAFGTYQSFQHAVAMGLLFGIAGFFASGAEARKGVGGFLRERAFRLGVPLLAYMFVIGPMTIYYAAGNWGARHGVSFARAWWSHVLDGSIAHESGPLWFCLVLLLFSLVFAAVVRALPRSVAPSPPPGLWAVLGFALAMAALTFGVGVLAPQGGTILNVPILDFPQYPLMFAAGVLAQRHDWLGRISTPAGRRWLFGGLLASALFWVVLIGTGGAMRGDLRPYFGGWHWQAAGMDVWRSCTCLALSIGLVTLYRDRCNTTGPVTGFLARNSFGVYVFHAPILVLITRALRETDFEVGLKFVAASVLATVASFVFVGVVARRVPWVRAVV
jgi:peptidoglycan/LPS O-acetylase OafA/YrhL